MISKRLALSLLLFGLSPFSVSRSDDWPQWMGKDRNGLWKESGLVDSIPASGLPVRWRVPVGGGYSGPAVVGDRAYLTDFVSETEFSNDPGSRAKRDGTERVLCLSMKTGEIVWKKEFPRVYNVSYASGPRATPTVDGNSVYVLGTEGDLVCLDTRSGDIQWSKSLNKEYQTETPIWGHSAHPLVNGDLLYCLAGGKGSVVVALNKKTGAEVWRALSASEIGYCPPSLVKINGSQQLVVWYPEAVCGLNPADGKVLWTYPLEPKYKMSINAPQFQGNRFYASGIGETAAMVEFDQSGMPTKTLWSGGDIKRAVYGANATPLWIGDALYGADCGSGQFIAVDSKTGKRLWETFQLTAGGDRRAGHGTAFLVQNGESSWIFAETGHLILAKLSPTGFEEKGRMKVLEPTGECFGRSVVWSHPAFADRCMIARNDKEVVCVELGAKK
jgi:outer membrane protein assembly factor BamB